MKEPIVEIPAADQAIIDKLVAKGILVRTAKGLRVKATEDLEYEKE